MIKIVISKKQCILTTVILIIILMQPDEEEEEEKEEDDDEDEEDEYTSIYLPGCSLVLCQLQWLRIPRLDTANKEKCKLGSSDIIVTFLSFFDVIQER